MRGEDEFSLTTSDKSAKPIMQCFWIFIYLFITSLSLLRHSSHWNESAGAVAALGVF